MNLPFTVPDNFKYQFGSSADDGTVTLYVQLQNISQCDEWVRHFSKLTRTSWVVKRRSDPNCTRMVCRRVFACHHSHTNKRTPHKKSTSKDLNCQAYIDIKVLNINRQSRRSHPHLNDFLPAVVKINNIHSHETISEKFLKCLPASAETKNEYFEYFDIGMGPMKAMKYHIEKLKTNNTDLIDGSINPVYRTVVHWHNMWRKNKHGSQSDVELNGTVVDVNITNNCKENDIIDDDITCDNGIIGNDDENNYSINDDEVGAQVLVRVVETPQNHGEVLLQKLNSKFDELGDPSPLATQIFIKNLEKIKTFNGLNAFLASFTNQKTPERQADVVRRKKRLDVHSSEHPLSDEQRRKRNKRNRNLEEKLEPNENFIWKCDENFIWL